MSDKDGGPAFPVVHAIVAREGMYTYAPAALPGMSLLDFFAGQAMKALIPQYMQGDPARWYDDIAKAAYEQAAAMLKEREK